MIAMRVESYCFHTSQTLYEVEAYLQNCPKYELFTFPHSLFVSGCRNLTGHFSVTLMY